MSPCFGVLAASLNRRDLIRGAAYVDQIGIDGSVLAFTVESRSSPAYCSGLFRRSSSPPARNGRAPRKHASHRIRGTLVVAEIAMAIMLLVGGALLIHSFLRLSSVERGYTRRTC